MRSAMPMWRRSATLRTSTPSARSTVPLRVSTVTTTPPTAPQAAASPARHSPCGAHPGRCRAGTTTMVGRSRCGVISPLTLRASRSTAGISFPRNGPQPSPMHSATSSLDALERQTDAPPAWSPMTPRPSRSWLNSAVDLHDCLDQLGLERGPFCPSMTLNAPQRTGSRPGTAMPSPTNGPNCRSDHRPHLPLLLTYLDRDLQQRQDSQGVLMGRHTYEVFAQGWPDRDGEYADWINATAKYVAS